MEENGWDRDAQTWKAATAGDIHVDAEGNWFYQGNKIIREDILAFFHEHLVRTGDNSYAIVWENQRCELTVDDTPLVITRVDRSGSGEGSGERFWLTLKHVPVLEELDPQSLWVGRDNVLYAQVWRGRFPARFSRPAYYQLAEWIQEDPAMGRFYLELNGRRYPIHFENAQQ